MKVLPSEISWSSYQQYEGPFWRGGKGKWVYPSNPTDSDKTLRVILATESGGNADAYNGYDSCIATSGLIQWCERNYSVSEMLGLVAEQGLEAIKELDPALNASNAVFKKNTRGRWRFHFLDSRGEVDRPTEQQQLFLLNSNGLKGSWDSSSKEHAKLWAACIASVWTYPDAITAQVNFTKPRLLGFATASAKQTLWGVNDPTTNEGLSGALRAGYLSFAANNPSIASKHLDIAVNRMGGSVQKWSLEWVVEILKELTFGPKIAIYPHRYNAIRPVLETYGIDLPDFAETLSAWHQEMDVTPEKDVPTFLSTKEIQEELVALNYDLGPAGADGIMGPKTTNAIMTFQRLNNLTPDGIVGKKTRQALLASWQSRN